MHPFNAGSKRDPYRVYLNTLGLKLLCLHSTSSERIRERVKYHRMLKMIVSNESNITAGHLACALVLLTSILV